MLTRFLIIFFISLFLLLPDTSFAAEGDLVWSKVRNFDTRSDNAYSISADSSGNIYVAGTFNNFGNFQWKIEKRNIGDGNLFWTQTIIPSSGLNAPFDVAVDSSGLYVAGYSINSVNSSYQWRIEKRSLVDGSLVWVQTVDLTTSGDVAYGVDVDSSGIYVVGSRGAQWEIEKRSLSDGSLVWSQAGNTGYATEVSIDSAGLYVVGANLNGDYEWRIEKRSLSDGSLTWSQISDPTVGSDIPHDIESDNSGVYIAGAAGQWRVEKRSLSDGSLIWSQTSSGWEARGVSVDYSGVYIAGSYYSGGVYQWQIEKRSLSDGSLLWNVINNPNGGRGEAFDIFVTASGIYVSGNEGIIATPGDQQWRIEKRALTNCTVTGSGRLTSGSGVYRIQAANGNQLLFYHNGSGAPNPITYTFTNCGAISGDISRPVGSALYGVGNGNAISIRDANASSTIFGNINFSNGANIVGTFSGLAGTGNPIISGSGNSLFTTDTGTMIMTFDYAVCSGPTSILWTDSPIIPNETKIRKVHIDELRSWIDDRRVDAGLPTFTWNDPVIATSTTKIRKVHFDDLRTAISQVYTTCGQPAPTWNDSTIIPNSTKIRAIHMTELRNAVSNAP